MGLNIVTALSTSKGTPCWWILILWLLSTSVVEASRPTVKAISGPVYCSNHPHYDQENQVLIYSSTYDGRISIYDPSTGCTTTTCSLDENIGAVIPLENSWNEYFVMYGPKLAKVYWDGCQDGRVDVTILGRFDQRIPGSTFSVAKADIKGRVFMDLVGPQSSDDSDDNCCKKDKDSKDDKDNKKDKDNKEDKDNKKDKDNKEDKDNKKDKDNKEDKDNKKDKDNKEDKDSKKDKDSKDNKDSENGNKDADKEDNQDNQGQSNRSTLNHYELTVCSLEMNLNNEGMEFSGIAWNCDYTKFYLGDTGTGIVNSYVYDCKTGRLSNESVAFDFTANNVKGGPGGIAADCNDNLWIACRNGYQVIQVNPQNGTVLQTIKFPVKDITSLCWGGCGLCTLFVTTSQANLNCEEKCEQPLAGSVFSVCGLNTRGLPLNNAVICTGGCSCCGCYDLTPCTACGCCKDLSYGGCGGGGCGSSGNGGCCNSGSGGNYGGGGRGSSGNDRDDDYRSCGSCGGNGRNNDYRSSGNDRDNDYRSCGNDGDKYYRSCGNCGGRGCGSCGHDGDDNNYQSCGSCGGCCSSKSGGNHGGSCCSSCGNSGNGGCGSCGRSPRDSSYLNFVASLISSALSKKGCCSSNCNF